MDGVLPKEVYAQLVPEEEPELFSNIVRIFKDIPENSTIDIFGEIYEYFLGNFALAEGKGGGTLYACNCCQIYGRSIESTARRKEVLRN